MVKELLDYFNGDELAASVWESKYQLKDETGEPLETTPDDMHKRMAKEFARIENNYKNKENKNYNIKDLSDLGMLIETDKSEVDYSLTEDKIYNYFKDFKYIVPQGSIMAMLGHTTKVGSLSNCFVAASPEDSYGGILYTDQQLAQLMKRRGGVGTNLNKLRPTSALVKNAAGSSTGVPSFAERYSNTTREVAQDGRRGALMLLLDCRHPDIFKFTTMKKDRTKVTGANVSVMLTDEFMKAVEADKDFICRFPIDNPNILGASHEIWSAAPYNKLIEWGEKGLYIMKIKARELFDLIVEMAWDNAEPGVAFIDRVNDYAPDGVYYTINKCNPCVTGDTQILTENGYRRIDSLINSPTNIWNGFNWSMVIPRVTGRNQEMLLIELSDGRAIKCTKYHKWILKNGKRIEAKELNIGDKLSKYDFPLIKGGVMINASKAYTQGFISGDGQDGYNHLWLYEPKYECVDRLDGYISSEFTTKSGVKRARFALNEEYKEKSFVPFEWDENSRLNWLAGLLDSDGTELIDGGSQICSIDRLFLKNVQDLLSTLGVNSKVLKERDEQVRKFPGNKSFLCKNSYRICIGASEIQKLKKLGLNCCRLKFNKFPNRSAQRFVYITNISSIPNEEIVYCFNEPLNHSGIFNGIMTANCGEQWLQDYDSCRLFALNLFSIVEEPFTNNAKVNYDLLYEISYIQQRLADDLVDLEIEYIKRIIDKIEKDPEQDGIKRNEIELWNNILATAKAGRRTGCGFTALGDMLAALGLKYDSDEALSIIEEVMRCKMQAELNCSIDLAILRKPFEDWKAEKEAYGNESGTLIYNNKFYEFLHNSEFIEECQKMWNFGRRNISWSTVAPTGTVSLMTQTTSGLEPLFEAYHIRRKKVNPNDKNIKVDFVDQNGDSWTEFPVLHPKFKDWLILEFDKEHPAFSGPYPTFEEWLTKEKLNEYFKLSPWYKACANDIDWKKRIEIQSIIQKYTTNAISSTINLPENVDKEVIANIYFEAWKSGLKGVTVYRDNCRTGVLVRETKTKEVAFSQVDAAKRPKELIGEGYLVMVKGVEYIVLIGLLEEKPYEIFASVNKWELPKNFNCKIIKKGKGKYDIEIEDQYTIKDFSHEVSDEEAVITRLVSTSLRHGTDVKFICEQLSKSGGNMVSFGKALHRTLKKYIPDGTISGLQCNECGSSNVILEEGCSKCRDCGSSKCG